MVVLLGGGVALRELVERTSKSRGEEGAAGSGAKDRRECSMKRVYPLPYVTSNLTAHGTFAPTATASRRSRHCCRCASPSLM